MLQSQLFCRTKKEAPKEAEVISHKLLVRADFISQLTSGIYSFLPLGYRVHKKIENIVREEVEKIGGQEVFLPAMQPRDLWQKTDRWEHMDPPLFKLKDRHQKEFVLGSTHEEVITELAQARIQSYKDLPLYLYQIQNKFRNEMRFTGGLLRTREFIMKDLYSFHSDEKDLNKYLDIVVKTYNKIFRRCGLEAIKSEASGGVIAGVKARTYEFQLPAKVGEDKVIFCSKCKWAANLEVAEVKAGENCPKCKGKLEKINAIEVGHAFSLGTKYAKALNLYFVDKKGAKKLVTMGCYGIGLGRLMGAIVEIYHDENGILWPKEVAPFDIHLIQIPSPAHSGAKVKKSVKKNFSSFVSSSTQQTKSSSLENTTKVKKAAEKLYQDLEKAGIEVLYDDRDKSPGEKFADADLIGIPVRIVISERTLEKNCLEIKKRNEKKTRLVKLNQAEKLLCSTKF